MAIEIFNRHENKYRLSGRAFAGISGAIGSRMDVDKYNERGETYPIFNVYYDTTDNDVIRASLSKPAYKEKLRLRSYGTPNADSTVYVEIKKKARGVVNKRRSAMLLRDAYPFLKSGIVPDIQPYMNEQVLNEAAYILGRKPLAPALFLSCERVAFFGERGLRVSFDTNIQTRRYDLRLEYGAYGEQLLGKGEWLMEIKTAESIPLWLSGLLAEYKAYPTSFSKYGAEYERSLTATPVKAARRIFIITPITAAREKYTQAVAAAVGGA